MVFENTAALLTFYGIDKPEKVLQDGESYLQFLAQLPEKATHMESHLKQLSIAHNLGKVPIDILSRFQRLTSVVCCDTWRRASQLHDEHKATLMARWNEAAEDHALRASLLPSNLFAVPSSKTDSASFYE